MMESSSHSGSASEQEAWLTQLDAAAQAAGGELAQAAFREFLRRYYEMSSLDALRQRTPEALLRLAFGHWRFAQRRAPGQALVRVLRPAADGTALAVLETCIEDQPFLVDSLTLAIRGAGSPIDWSVHPVLRVRRDAEGRWVALAGSSGEGTAESWIHFEFEPLADEDAYAALERQAREVLADLQCVVADYAPILSRLRALSEELKLVPPGGDAEEFAEAREFLAYLDQHHFTFLGYLESRAEPGPNGRVRFHSQPESGLGLLRAGSRWSEQDLIAPPAELDKYVDSPRLVVVTKANLRSTIHRGELMDVVSVKRFDATGRLTGTARFVGLFSSEVYLDRPRNIPLIRRKVEYVLRRSRLPEHSHSGKNLRDILHGLPRDELFQSSEEELYQLCMGIRALRDRHGLRLFMRRDRYGRFYSCLVYLPRERYSRELRDKIGAALLELCGGWSYDREVEFLRSGLTRVHYIVRTPPGTTIPCTAEEVQARLVAATRTWRDQLRELLIAQGGVQLAARFADAFPLSYQETVPPEEAAEDVRALAQLTPSQPLLPRLLVESAEGAARIRRLKLYVRGEPASLSDVLPWLEHFGFKVIRQEPAEVRPKGSQAEPALWVQEFEVEHPGSPLPAARQREYFESAWLALWRGEIENDGLNRLVLAAGLNAREVALLRAMCKYLIQTGLPYSQAYMETLLAEHAEVARLLVRAFEARLAPTLDESARRDESLKLGQALDHALDQVVTLDGDRVLRAFLSVVRASVRTNYFQTTARGQPKAYISFKLDPGLVPELPLPRPKHEIWVYAPQVEGVHLRGGKVARGGIRWSDRPQDFRTEVLGLMKAQMVKNTVIVPVGAKGGFVVKKGPAPADREAYQAHGIECYKTFLRGLLDLTDNRLGDAVVPPPQTVRYDDDDPYLVVAADKGTATFSDIANEVAAEYEFWLGDAFASGGSAGYDHKKMGITARGAWESVKRHFRELGKNIAEQEFTAVGIGDMSGDVFGNGMLLSRKLKLIAAFDHRHIFLDPDPDPEVSFGERERLFHLPRSSWADYDAARISKGGGVYPRSAKLIRLSEQARRALDVNATALTPNELIRAILRAPVDLLWNGGIGTYVKASTQSHLDVGDRGNDAVRVNGRELRCQVVGEGGNLGFTQAGRIEYALYGCGGAGGRLNTDAIDNAAGVHTSDREVNIKIPLNELLRTGRLTRAQRDPLLAELTDDVARAVLRDNYVQSAAISLLAQNASARLDDHAELMRLLEREGLLDRALEALPDEDTLKERRTRGLGLTRPELAVLIAYSKISLYQALLASDVPDDPFFERDLLAYFPPRLVERYRAELATHRLRREIVATILSNAIVNRMGAGFAQLWAEDHGLTRAEVLKAYATAHQIYGGDDYWLAIEALDNQVPAALQYRLMNYAIGLLKHATGWFTRSQYAQRPVKDAVQRFTTSVAAVEKLLPEVLPPSYREDWERTVTNLRKERVPETLALRLANTRALGGALDIAELAEHANVSITEAAGVYYLAGERFHMLWLYAAINELPTSGKWQALARVNLRDDAYLIHRQLAGRILQTAGANPQERLERWSAANERRVKLGLARLAELQTANTREFATLAVAVREIRKLRML
jgi:glutamate dehydrogenase